MGCAYAGADAIMEMITAGEFARRLDVHSGSVTRAALGGKLPGAVRVKHNSPWDIPEELVAKCSVHITKKGYRRVTWPAGNYEPAEKREPFEYLNLPRCQNCGVVLGRDEYVGRDASSTDATYCEACKDEGWERMG